MPRKRIGNAITTITFPYFLADKESYNLLDCFRMRIMEELRFFFFYVEDTALNQKLCVKWCEILNNRVCGLRRKRHSNLHKAFTEKFKALYMLRRFQRRF